MLYGTSQAGTVSGLSYVIRFVGNPIFRLRNVCNIHCNNSCNNFSKVKAYAVIIIVFIFSILEHLIIKNVAQRKFIQGKSYKRRNYSWGSARSHRQWPYRSFYRYCTRTNYSHNQRAWFSAWPSSAWHALSRRTYNTHNISISYTLRKTNISHKAAAQSPDRNHHMRLSPYYPQNLPLVEFPPAKAAAS